MGELNRNTPEALKQFSDFFKKVDPYDHLIAVRTGSSREAQTDVYNPLLGYPTFDGASLRTLPESTFSDVLHWVDQSALAGRKWVVSCDDQGPSDEGVLPDVNDTEHNSTRQAVLWGTFMAGGAYVQLLCLYHWHSFCFYLFVWTFHFKVESNTTLDITIQTRT